MRRLGCGEVCKVRTTRRLRDVEHRQEIFAAIRTRKPKRKRTRKRTLNRKLLWHNVGNDIDAEQLEVYLKSGLENKYHCVPKTAPRDPNYRCVARIVMALPWGLSTPRAPKELFQTFKKPKNHEICVVLRDLHHILRERSWNHFQWFPHTPMPLGP